MAFTLPDLPFAKDALAPHMSAETLDFHHGKHHKAYVDKVNELVGQTSLADGSLTELIRHAKEKGDKKLFNNAAQHWNHSFFWQCLAAPEGQRPTGKLAAMIEDGFGGTDAAARQAEGRSGRPFRQRLGLAGARRRQAQDHLAPRRRHAGRP